MITQIYLKSRLRYDPNTGYFIWISMGKHHQRFVGQRAGTIREGYIYLKIDERSYSAHRVAWLYMYGRWPKKEIDHKNRNGTDNRISNLREATRGQNTRNHGRTVGKDGWPVGIRPCGNRFNARVNFRKVRYYLGTFDTLAEATAAYWAKRQELFGEFA